ncbi:MAG TPA: T9SS type A sorting domain-containing protein, partial [Bacteroidia bacterium]|nr:T9SS type A sorting domain-containing protein [Bacteroidia bacterium]
GFELQKIAQATATYIGQTTDGMDTLHVLVKNCAVSPNAINEINGATMTVYPNPSASGIFHVQMPANSEGHTIKVIDLTGREIGTVKENTVDLSSAKSGVYLLTVTAPDYTVWYQKLVKE